MTVTQSLQWLASYTVQAALVVGVAAALDRWSRAATTKCRVWTACFVSLLGLFAVGLLLPHAQWPSPWTNATPDTLLAAMHIERSLGSVVTSAWLFGVAVMLVRAGIDFARIQAFIARQPKASDALDQRLRSLVDDHTLRPAGKAVEFRIGPEDVGPFCYQFHRPLVFIPDSMLRGSAEELRLVLEHELTHLRTQHPLQVFLQKATQCLLWFHPLVWIASGRANLVREFVCDDAASRGGASTAAYLRTLLRTVEQQGQPRRGGLTIGRSVSEVRQRAARLISCADPVSGPSSLHKLATLVGAAAIASQVWLPIDPLVSSRWGVSPWPVWSAAVLHSFDVRVRDFEPFEGRTDVHELTEDLAESE